MIIIRPLVNEKSMSLTKSGMYTFEVGLDASKKQIEKMAKEKFGVDVLDVKTINVHGKKKLQRSRKGYFVTSGIRKAIIKIKKGQKIALFEAAVNEEQEVEVKTADTQEESKVKEKKSLLRGTKVRIETSNKEQDTRDKEEQEKKADAKRPTKVSQKEGKK